MAHLELVRTSVLDIGYEQSGPHDAYPVVLLHGFPYDPRAFDEVALLLNRAGFRTIVPYLRGYRRHAISFSRYDAIRRAGCPGAGSPRDA